MTPILIVIIGLALGWGGHRTRPLVDRLSRGWRELTASGIGILLIWPVYVAAYWYAHPEERDWFVRANVIFWGAVLPVGAAVTLGWLYDTAQEKTA